MKANTVQRVRGEREQDGIRSWQPHKVSFKVTGALHGITHRRQVKEKEFRKILPHFFLWNLEFSGYREYTAPMNIQPCLHLTASPSYKQSWGASWKSQRLRDILSRYTLHRLSTSCLCSYVHLLRALAESLVDAKQHAQPWERDRFMPSMKANISK